MSNGNERPRRGEYEGGDDFRALEQRVRAIEDTINKVSGVMSVARWVLPPLITGCIGIGLFFLGRSAG